VAAKQVFQDDMGESVRLSALYRAVLFDSVTKQESMFTCALLLASLLFTLSKSEDSVLSVVFYYTPEHYLEALADTFHALRRGDPAFPMATSPERHMYEC